MAKVKKYQDGGITEGANPNIDEDVRARAMRWVQQQQEGGQQEEAPVAKPVVKAAPRPMPKAAPRVTDTGDETARLKARAPAPKPKYETPYDRMNRRNREEAAARSSAAPRGQDRILRDVRPGQVNPKTMLPTGMKKGGSVGKASSRADGIAQRGKTKGRLV